VIEEELEFIASLREILFLQIQDLREQLKIE
jgi:hypothetical protein